MSFESKLNQYATLIIKKGINVQSGQTVILYASVDQVVLARKIVNAAYLAGAKQVIVEWSDQLITQMNINAADEELLTTTPQYTIDKWQDLIVNQHASRISLLSDDPDGLAHVDAHKLSTLTQTKQRDLAMVRNATMRDDISWLVVAAASPAWAQKVFPNTDPAEAQQRLWEAIFKTVRIDDHSDALENWDRHIKTLQEKADWLNKHNFKSLHYKNEHSDFTIGLAAGHIWEAAFSHNKAGDIFIPNMPTEEVFTAPDNRYIDGHVAATLPLSYQGNIIENIALDFKDGRIVKATATKGMAILQKIIDTDEGAKSLGEVSLVPHPSPISQSGILFYNTLFDENASDHLAIGAAYASNIKDGKTASPETLSQRGWNISDTHVDFMIGSADMDIDGITQDGQLVPVFRQGDWA